jgi:hypothetical protein
MLIASPQYAMPHAESFFSILWNCCSATSYSNECSAATADSKSFCTFGHDVGKLSLPEMTV